VGTEDYAIIEPNGVFESIPKNENKVFSVVDEAATPVLGINSFFEQLSYTIQYPEKARNNGIEGKVYIGFVVQTDGTVTDAKVIKGLNDEIDTEALRAFYQVNSSWYPAIHQGQIVKMKMVLPIVFSLQSQSHKSGTESSHRMEAAFVFTPNTKSNSQKNSIEGLVQTNDGSPLPGVKVNVKNSTTEVYTDSNGKFTVDTSETNGLLQFFFVGFESLEMKFGSI
jgi:TonB family protein